LEDNDHYLRVISDVPTRWNSSYLAWKRLLKIRNLIDVMASSLSIDSDAQARKDGKRLKKINLVDDEWEALKKLTNILEKFAEATEILGGSNYTTISFMYQALEIIKKDINVLIEEPVEIDLTTQNTVFDENIGYIDSPEDEIDTDYPKERNISIEIPQNCKNLEKKVKKALYQAMNHYWDVPREHGMIGALLDPRCKELRFFSENLKIRTQEQLRSIYEDLNEEDYNHRDGVDKQFSNSLLASMFMQNIEKSDEVSDYLAIPQIQFNGCPLEWWKMNERKFPILSNLAKKYLCIPATSTPSERLFSDAGNIMTIKRTQLLPSTFEHLLFLKRNWNLAGGIFPKDNSVISKIQTE
jgi:hypothetical protein